MADETAQPIEAAPTSTPEPAVSAAPEVSSAPDAAPEQPASITPDSFGWDAWDGSSYDPFPEQVRPWVERVAGRLTTEAQRTQKLLDELLAGGEDPRLAEFTSKYQTAEQQRAELEKKYTELEQWLEKQEDARSDQEVEQYASQHPWLFEEGSDAASAAAAALEAGWDWKVLHEVVKLQPAARKIADEAFKETKNASFALRLARAESGPSATGSHTVVAGATSGAAGRDVPVQPKVVGRVPFRDAVANVLDNVHKLPARS